MFFQSRILELPVKRKDSGSFDTGMVSKTDTYFSHLSTPGSLPSRVSGLQAVDKINASNPNQKRTTLEYMQFVFECSGYRLGAYDIHEMRSDPVLMFLALNLSVPFFKKFNVCFHDFFQNICIDVRKFFDVYTCLPHFKLPEPFEQMLVFRVPGVNVQ